MKPPIIRRHSLQFFPLLLAALAVRAGAADIDQNRGRDFVVHFVRLTGHTSDNARERELLVSRHNGCVEMHKIQGVPSKPLPPEGIPAVPQPLEVEIYYAADRTLTVKRGKVHIIRPEDCALVESPRHVRTLRTAAGLCDIDMLKLEARGVCGEGPEWTLPAGVRASTMFPPFPTEMPPTKLAGKTIAGHACEAYVWPGSGYEFCIAQPRSSFRIPAAPFNGGLTGLLLETANPAVTLKAEEVVLEMGVSKSLFAVPANVKTRPIAGRR